MCWVGRGPAKIAEKDIVVYKLGYVFKNSEVFSSLYHGYNYHPKGLNRTVTLVPIVGGVALPHLSQFDVGIIYSGYHSYQSISLPFNGLGFSFRAILLGTIIKERINICNSYYIATFIIPKGSEYYVNKCGELVSSNIIYTGKYVKI